MSKPIDQKNDQIQRFLFRVENQNNHRVYHTNNPVVHHDHYHHGYYDPYYYGPSPYRPSSSAANKKDKIVMAGIMSVFAGIGYFFHSIFSFADSRSNYLQTCKIEKMKKKNNPKLETLVRYQKSIDSSTYNKDTIHLLSSTGLLTSGSALLYGGCYSAEDFVTAGIIGVVTSVATGVVNKLYHYNDDRYYAFDKRKSINLARELMPQFA